MLYNDSVSILDVATDDNGIERIIQYVLKGVYLERSSGVAIDKDGEKRAYNCTLFVPSSVKCSESYVAPKSWEKMSFENKLLNYTFRDGQLIVETESALSYGSIDAVCNSEEVVYHIIGVDYLTKVIPHFEVLGR